MRIIDALVQDLVTNMSGKNVSSFNLHTKSGTISQQMSYLKRHFDRFLLDLLNDSKKLSAHPDFKAIIYDINNVRKYITKIRDVHPKASRIAQQPPQQPRQQPPAQQIKGLLPPAPTRRPPKKGLLSRFWKKKTPASVPSQQQPPATTLDIKSTNIPLWRFEPIENILNSICKIIQLSDNTEIKRKSAAQTLLVIWKADEESKKKLEPLINRTLAFLQYHESLRGNLTKHFTLEYIKNSMIGYFPEIDAQIVEKIVVSAYTYLQQTSQRGKPSVPQQPPAQQIKGLLPPAPPRSPPPLPGVKSSNVPKVDVGRTAKSGSFVEKGIGSLSHITLLRELYRTSDQPKTFINILKTVNPNVSITNKTDLDVFEKIIDKLVTSETTGLIDKIKKNINHLRSNIGIRDVIVRSNPQKIIDHLKDETHKKEFLDYMTNWREMIYNYLLLLNLREKSSVPKAEAKIVPPPVAPASVSQPPATPVPAGKVMPKPPGSGSKSTIPKEGTPLKELWDKSQKIDRIIRKGLSEQRYAAIILKSKQAKEIALFVEVNYANYLAQELGKVVAFLVNPVNHTLKYTDGAYVSNNNQLERINYISDGLLKLLELLRLVEERESSKDSNGELVLSSAGQKHVDQIKVILSYQKSISTDSIHLIKSLLDLKSEIPASPTTEQLRKAAEDLKPEVQVSRLKQLITSYKPVRDTLIWVRLRGEDSDFDNLCKLVESNFDAIKKYVNVLVDYSIINKVGLSDAINAYEASLKSLATYVLNKNWFRSETSEYVKELIK